MTDMLFICQVPEYLYMKYNVRRTRRAISTRDNQLYTRQRWVDNFIDKVSRRDTK